MVKRTVAQVITQRLNGRTVKDNERVLRLFPLTQIVVCILKKFETPRPIEYIHNEEVAMAMIKIIERFFGITEEDFASECERVFGFDRKGPKDKVKTEQP